MAAAGKPQPLVPAAHSEHTITV